MGYRLGVDLGTTFTSAATSSDGHVSMLDLGKDSAQIPSVLLVSENGSFLVGQPAERRGTLEPNRVVREFKRRVGDPVPIVLAGSPYSAQSLMAILLRWVVAQATERLGEPPDDLVVTYPANWGPYKEELLNQALRLADQPDAQTLTEPAAAARLYASRTRVRPGEIVGVYDLGGGTFDAAVLRKQEEGFELLGTPEGIEQLGGIDFDEAVFAHVIDAIRDRISDLPMDDPDTRLAIARLRRDCVEAKETLSVDTEVTVPVLLPGVSTSVRLVRSEFEDMIRPALRDTMGAMRRAITSARVEPNDIRAVVLIGGSSRIPLVTEMLTEEFGRPTALDTHPKNDVAMGAALEDGVSQTVLEPRIPQPQVPRPTVTPPSTGDQPDTRKRPVPVASVTQPAKRKRRLLWIVPTGVLAVAAGVIGTLALQNASDADVGAEPDVSESPTTEQTPESPGPGPDGNGETLADPIPDRVALVDRDGIKTIDVDTGEASETFDLDDFVLPTIAPDRRSIVALRRPGSADDGWVPIVVDPSGMQQELLPDGEPCSRTDRPAWNQTGDRIAFRCTNGDAPGLYVATTEPDERGVLAGVTDQSLLPTQALAEQGLVPRGSLTWHGNSLLVLASAPDASDPEELWRIPVDDPEAAARLELGLEGPFFNPDVSGDTLLLQAGNRTAGILYTVELDAESNPVDTAERIEQIGQVVRAAWPPGDVPGELLYVDAGPRQEGRLRLFTLGSDRPTAPISDVAGYGPPIAWGSR